MRSLFNVEQPLGLWMVAPIAGIISIWPWLFLALNGDDYHHYVIIQCFAEQVWSGHLYPRWCMNANAGYGSPVPIFYMPAPYYLTALFYPLHYFGADPRSFLVLGLLVASVIGFVSTTLWLSTATTRVRAAFCAFIMCWLGYRVEMATFRIAYPELLCVAFLPWLFLEVRHLVLGNRPRWARLALLITGCMLTHILATLIALIGCCIYLLVMSSHRLKYVLWLAFPTLLALIATLFHWVQYMQFLPSLSDATLQNWKEGWANNYLTMDNIYTRLPVMLISYLHLFILIFFAGHILRKPGLIGDSFVKRELCAWGIIGIVALFMMFPISQPIWHIMQVTVHVRAPWRMQLLTMFSFIFLLAVFSRYYWGVVVVKRIGDAVCLVLFMMLLSSTTLYPSTDESMKERTALVRQHYLLDMINTRWTAYLTSYKNFRDFAANKPVENARLIHRDGKVLVGQWNDDGIRLNVDTKEKSTLRIEQFYFPLWRATINGKPAELKPDDDGLGRMLIDVPAGKSDVMIRQDLMAAMPPYFRWVCLASLLSFFLMLGGLYYNTKKKLCGVAAIN